MKITFYIHDNGEREFLWDWRDANYVPRKDEFISLESLGYGYDGIGKVTIVRTVIWDDKDNVKITLGL